MQNNDERLMTKCMTKHIYPIFERTLQRTDREILLKQKGIMIWFIRIREKYFSYRIRKSSIRTRNSVPDSRR